MSRLIDADALIADCQLAQKQADRHGREFANAFYSGGGEISTEWWCVEDMIENAPTIEPEQTKYIQDTKAVPSDRDCVDLSEKVTATFYDDEHEEWSQRTVTIRDVLDSVCDSYTVIEPERKTARWIPRGCGCFECGECGERVTLNAYTAEKASDRFRFCYHCGARMEEGEQE